MGQIEEGLKGLNDKMGVDMDNLSFSTESIQEEVEAFVKNALTEFIRKLDSLKNDQLSNHLLSRSLEQQIDNIICKLGIEIDSRQSKDVEIKFVNSYVNRLENDAETQDALTSTVVTLLKKAASAKRLVRDEEINRAVHTLTSDVKSKARRQADDIPQNTSARAQLPDPKVLELDKNKINELQNKVKDGLKSELINDVKELKILEIKQDINHLIKELNSTESEIRKEADHLYDVLEVGYLLHYIRYEKASKKQYPNGIRDDGNEGKTLDDFLKDEKSKKANLTENMIVALRLYTTVAYKFMNGPLRNANDVGNKILLPATTWFADQGIKKLRVLQTKQDISATRAVLWRGVRNVGLDQSFTQTGGTEYGFMSTTTDLEVAVKYSFSKTSLLFKLVPSGPHEMGADLQWLSAFPSEKEILYPPLTHLQPAGDIETIKLEVQGIETTFTVVPVKPLIGT